MSVLEDIRRSKPKTSNELFGARDRVRAAIPEAEERLAEAQRARSALLLDGSSKEIETADNAARKCERELADLKEALIQLDRRLVDAHAAEERREMERRAEAVKVKLDKAVELEAEAIELFARVVAIAHETVGSRSGVDNFNRECREKGFPDLHVREASSHTEILAARGLKIAGHGERSGTVDKVRSLILHVGNSWLNLRLEKSETGKATE